MISEGSRFPYLWTTRNGTALLQVATGGRIYHTSEGDLNLFQSGFFISRDGLRTWQPWHQPAVDQTAPWLEGCEIQLPDGTILMFEYMVRESCT